MANNKTSGLLESLREPISRRNFLRTLIVTVTGVTFVLISLFICQEYICIKLVTLVVR